MSENKKKVRLKTYVDSFCPKCVCGAKEPTILEVTDTHIRQVNYLGVEEVIDRASYEATMKAAGVYSDALSKYLDDAMPNKVVKARKKRLKVVCQTQKGS